MNQAEQQPSPQPQSFAPVCRLNDVRAFQKKQDSLFSTLFTRRISRVITFVLIRWFPRVTPNQVSIFSLLLTIVAVVLMVHEQYVWRLLGAVLLQLGFAFDCSDGELARASNQQSPFGAWLDSFLDRCKEVLMLGALTFYWYMYHGELLSTLAVGAGAIIGLQLVSYMREAKKSTWPQQRTSELFISTNIYIGTVDMTVYLVTAAALFEMQLVALWIFALISIPLMLKQLRSAYRLHSKG